MNCECGGELKKIGKIGATCKRVCSICYKEHIKYVDPDPCEHEYSEKHGDRCIHCGE